LGPPGHGKSSVGNTIIRILNNEPYLLPLATASNKKGTLFYQTIPEMPDHIRIFDSPGILPEPEAVKRLIEGIREEFSIADCPKGGPSKIMDKHLDPNNKIDYVIYVLKATVLEVKSGYFSYRVSPSKEDLPPDVIRVIKELTGHEPFVFITHANNKKCSELKYKELIKEAADGNIRLIENYTKIGELKNSATDAAIAEVLSAIAVNNQSYKTKLAERDGKEGGKKIVVLNDKGKGHANEDDE